MTQDILVRALAREDYDNWLPLWQGYNEFYERCGDNALPDEVTATTWERFFDPAEAIWALVACQGERLVGMAHYLYHRSSSRLQLVCYLQDLYTVPDLRGQGVGRALIKGVGAAAEAAGSRRVYWQTHVENRTARGLYDQMARHEGFIIYARDLPFA